VLALILCLVANAWAGGQPPPAAEYAVVVAPARVTAAQVRYDGDALSGWAATSAAELDLLARQGRPAPSHLVSPLERAERRVAGHPTRFRPLADGLNARAAEGYRLVTVAKPEFPFVPRNLVALMARTPGDARPVGVRHEVVGSFLAWQVEARINELAAQGYRVAGVTLAADPLFGREYAFEAVMARDPADGDPPSTYRVVRTGLRDGDWRTLERAGREGFRVLDILWRPDLTTAARGDLTFLLERRGAGAGPLVYTLKWENSTGKLERALNEFGANGHRAVIAWAARDFLNALLVVPAQAPPPRPAQYEVDGDPLGLPAISSLSGRLVDWARFKGEQVAIYEKGHRASYDVVAEPLVDRPTDEAMTMLDRPDVETLLGRLNRKGTEGFETFRATYRQEAPGRERLEVFLTKP
jgi:hypothetical protein